MTDENTNKIPLKDYVDKIIDLQFKSYGKALDLARHNLEGRLDSMNEIREQLNSQSLTFVTKVEWGVVKERIEKEIKSLELSRAELAGKASQASVNLALLLSILGLVFGALRYFG